MARPGTFSVWALGAIGASALAGAPGCLDLDDYELVEGAGGRPATGGSGSGTGGVEGAGGAACTQQSGTVFSTFRTRAVAPTFETGAGCDAPLPTGASGVDVVAVAGALGRCEGHLRIAASPDAVFSVLERAQSTRDGSFAVAGSLSSGRLELPLSCDGPSRLTLAVPPGASEGLFVVRFQVESSAFCTSWVRVIGSTSAPGTVRLSDVDVGDDGSVAIAGTLGGVEGFLDDGPTRLSLRGGPFLATFARGGPLRTFTKLEPGPSSPGTSLGVGFDGAAWMAAGATLLDAPTCHDCGGSSHVTEAAAHCAAPADAGAADAGPADSATPMDATRDASQEAGALADAGRDASVRDAGALPEAGTPPDAPLPDAAQPDGESGAPPEAEPRSDAVNAFVVRSGSGLGCGRLDTFGSDADPADLQAALDVSATRLACGAYVTGLAGVGTFRLDGADAASALAPGTDGIADAFVARFAGGPVSGCSGSPGGPQWSLRATSTGRVTGTKVRADVCNLGAVSTLLVEGSTPRGVSLRRCSPDTSCDAAESIVTLGDSSDQAVVMAVDAQGELEWHAAMGPLVLGEAPLGGSRAVPLPALDLTSDGADDAYVLFDTRATPRLHNVRLTRCDSLNVATPSAGLWLVKLDRGGVGGEADCRFAVHLGSGAR